LFPGTGSSVKEFTFLQIHVLHMSHPAVLEGSMHYAREIVDGFFKKHTRIDVNYIETYDNKFRNLISGSRLEIAFLGRPKGYKVPNYHSYKYEISEGLAVVFEVETCLIKRYILPHCEFDVLEVERTDLYLLTWCTQRQVADMGVSYINM
jgi:hypothetical protein